MSPRTSPQSRRRRARALHSEEPRDEGTGGSGGVVLPLNMAGAGMYEAVYTIDVHVGSNSQDFSLQVDTGSSDLWIASVSCSSAACASSKGRQYDPSVSGVTTGSQFSIEYLVGNVSGPIYWDRVQIGAYTINNQALAAATSVDSEPLEHGFNGILGLALPANSLIAHSITPVTGNGRDGAPFPSNLFGITPANSAPEFRFFSLSLSRPGSSAVPSQLGIGRHPSQLVPDPSKLKYSTVVPQKEGTFFWEVEVHAITLYINSSAQSISIDHPRSGNTFPSAVLDSGVPFILTSTNVANGIYGALGIGPASDGQYYVPCTTPLNMTITIDGQPEMPLHPLDLTTESQTNPSSSTCVGLIQTAGGVMDTSSQVSDMILGVPFLRNVYTVMAYDVPDASGKFPNNSDADTNDIHPMVGLLSLTNATQAMQEFDNVRVLNIPLSSGNPSSPTSGQARSSDDSRMSTGIHVLLALVGVIAACFALFGLRWFLVRRRLRRSPHLDTASPKYGGVLATYPLENQTSYLSTDSAPARVSLSKSITGNSALTVVGQDDGAPGEFGFRRPKDKGNDTDRRAVSYLNLDPGDPDGWRDTLVGSTIDFPESTDPRSALEAALMASDGPMSSTRDAALAAEAAAGLPIHRHTASDIGTGPGDSSVAEPLLGVGNMEHGRDDSVGSIGALSMGSVPRADDEEDDDLAEFGTGRESMAGIGTAARSPRMRARHASGAGSFGSLASMSLPSTIVDPGPRPTAYFMSIAPGERMSYSITDATAKANTIPRPPPPPPPS